MIPPAFAISKGVGCRTQAKIGGMVPVFLVMPRGKGEAFSKIGDFIMEIACFLKPFRCLHEKIVLQIFFRKSKLAPSIFSPERGFIFQT